MKYIVVILLTFIVLINFSVTYKVIINDSLEKFQKVAFSFIVWIIPLIGAFGILTFIKNDETPKGPRNPNDGAGEGSMRIASGGD